MFTVTACCVRSVILLKYMGRTRNPQHPYHSQRQSKDINKNRHTTLKHKGTEKPNIQSCRILLSTFSLTLLGGFNCITENTSCYDCNLNVSNRELELALFRSAVGEYYICHSHLGKFVLESCFLFLITFRKDKIARAAKTTEPVLVQCN